MRISTRSWPACVCTSEAYLAACCGAAMWSILILIPVSFVKRGPISASFLSESGAKLFQQRYEISRCCPRAGGTPAARIPARPAPVVVVNCRRVREGMTSPIVRGSLRMPASSRPARFSLLRTALGSSYYTGRPVLVALAQHLLVELSDARLGHRVDDLDRVGQRPAGQLRAEELDDLARLERAAGLGHHAGQRALDPPGVRHRDDRRLQDFRMAHDEVLDVDARHPLAAGLDQVLRPVGDLHVPLGVDRGDVAGAEPSVRR